PEKRGRAPQDQELRQEVAERDQVDPGRDGPLPRHAPRSGRARAAADTGRQGLRSLAEAMPVAYLRPRRSSGLNVGWRAPDGGAPAPATSGGAPGRGIRLGLPRACVLDLLGPRLG